MAILVTGGCGYIGSVTVERLLAIGQTVVVLDDLVGGHRGAIAPGVPLYQGKVGDRALIERIATEHRLEACIHFAALTSVNESVAQPALYFENNVGQGVALLDVLRQVGLRNVVFSSSCATYGEPQSVPIDETHRQSPQTPYGWSKLFMERVLESFDQAHGLRFVALRYFNAAGATERCGEDHHPETHLIPIALQAARSGGSITLFGSDYPTPDGTAIRDYIHVSDLASAHIAALQYLRGGGGSTHLNLGSGRGCSVREVIETVERVTGRSIRCTPGPRRPGDPSHLVARSDKAREMIGWVPERPDLATIVRDAWAWREAHPAGYGHR